MPLRTEVGLGPGDTALDRDPSPSPPRKGAQQPPLHFSAHVYCGQPAGWIRIPLGMEVGLGPGDTVLDGNPASPRKTAQQPSVHFALARSPISATAELMLISRDNGLAYPTGYRSVCVCRPMSLYNIGVLWVKA